ncbi:MAG: methyltransferase [Gammaproteobacteria bacterium]|nr:methyltransferase [Gammaproteobacteria bacterium]
MSTMYKRITGLLTWALLCGLSLQAGADLKEDLTAAMASELRTEAEKARDANRKPVATLEFFGLTSDMRVLELVPGGGWYTKLLGPVLADNGKLYVSIGTRGVERIKAAGNLPSVEVVANGGQSERTSSGNTIAGLTIDVTDIDMALTFRNLHNFSPDGRKAINEVVFEALKGGGIYGVVDHTRRHMQGDNSENGRRLDPVLVIKEIEEAGFEFVDSSNLHYRPDDELVYEVGRRTVTGNSDRFTLLFRKPE